MQNFFQTEFLYITKWKNTVNTHTQFMGVGRMSEITLRGKEGRGIMSWVLVS